MRATQVASGVQLREDIVAGWYFPEMLRMVMLEEWSRIGVGLGYTYRDGMLQLRGGVEIGWNYGRTCESSVTAIT